MVVETICDYFALDGEQVGVGGGRITSCITVLGVDAPTGEEHTLSSLRIGAYTEEFIIEVPLEVRLYRFGWGPRNKEMAALYFDRTLKVFGASLWVFGRAQGAAPIGVPVSSAFC